MNAYPVTVENGRGTFEYLVRARGPQDAYSFVAHYLSHMAPNGIRSSKARPKSDFDGRPIRLTVWRLTGL